VPSPAKKIEWREPAFDEGVVVATDATDATDAGIRVRLPDGEVAACRAKSCVVEPAVGDTVLLARGRAGWWVLAVLCGETAVRIAVEGDLEIAAPRGRVRVVGDEGIELTARRTVDVISSKLGIHTVDATAVFERMTLIGAKLRADVGAISAIAGAVETVVERVTERAKRVYRFIEELDQVRAEHIDYAATKLCCVRGENTVMTAGECVKIDGEQVHIG
jgi:hypothetical protein